MVARVRYVDVPDSIHCYAVGARQGSASSGASVARKSLVSIAHDRGDDAVEIDLSDAIIRDVSDIEVSAGVYGKRFWPI